jgi:signal peptidase I
VAKKEIKSEEKPRETMVEFLASSASVLVIGLFVITFIFQNFEIPSSSMENTLLIGDHVLVNRVQFSPATRWLDQLLPYREIKRGDIVVFLHPQEPGLYVVKRVMGIPGDRIHLRDGVVYRKGEKLDEPYTIPHDPNEPFNYRDNFPSGELEGNPQYPDGEMSLRSHIEGDDLVVPPNSYFGMGDHRDVSLDSRFWGFIPRENVVGRPMFIYWSFETPRDQVTKTDMTDRLSFIAHVVFHFFDETRWARTLKAVR